MNRREFTGALFALGAVALSPIACSPSQGARKEIDPNLTVFLSDIHICGELEGGKSLHYPNNPISLKQHVDQILSLNPLPAHVFIFGDVAWDYGLEEDYIYAKELLQPLKEAGIQITLGLGNHDRRAAFFKVFPEYKETTKVAGRAVSVVELPYADFVMLDTLSELPELPPRKSTNVFGELDEAQLEWLKKFLAESKRPVFLGAHHPLGDLPALTELITHSPIVAGFICGHLHIWSKKAYLLRPRKPERMIPVVELPSTFYGDIGFATFRMDPQGAILSFSSQGFWWPEPAQNPPPQWEARQKDLANETCRFIFNKI